MLAKVAKLARYKVVVLGLKPRKGHPPIPPDGIPMFDNDRIFGYGYRQHRQGKYFDLWFTNPKEDDQDNFITFGRITRIDDNPDLPGKIYHTKLGRFYVEETRNGTHQENKKDQKDRKNSQKNHQMLNVVNYLPWGRQ